MSVKDKKRLDWITDKAIWGVGLNSDQRIVGKWKADVGGGCDGYGETPRQAIDAAMRAGKRG